MGTASRLGWPNVIMGATCATLVIVGALVWRAGKQQQAGDDEVANDQTGRVPVVEFEEFATELKQPPDLDDERRLVLSFSLEVRTLADRQLVIDRREEIRDKVIEFFMDRLPESVEGSANMEAVKAELKTRINDLLPGEPLQAIYFDNFVVQ